MGHAGAYTPEKLVIAVLSAREEARSGVMRAAEEAWGPVDYQSPELPFPWSHYYDAEMGAPLRRSFFTLRALVDPSRLASLKKEANAMEERWSADGKRAVNLDPGLLSLSRFVLATTKENAHRIPLSDGIYGEVTLLYARGGFRPLEWTYPDYRSAEYLAILNDIRARYKAQLREGDAVSAG